MCGAGGVERSRTDTKDAILRKRSTQPHTATVDVPSIGLEFWGSTRIGQLWVLLHHGGDTAVRND